jgi:hypothetical protein
MLSKCHKCGNITEGCVLYNKERPSAHWEGLPFCVVCIQKMLDREGPFPTLKEALEAAMGKGCRWYRDDTRYGKMAFWAVIDGNLRWRDMKMNMKGEWEWEGNWGGDLTIKPIQLHPALDE